MNPLLVTVAVPVPLYRGFDYLLPASLAAGARPGVRVRVPFGRRKLCGVIVRAPFERVDDSQDYRPLDAVLDDAPLLGAELLALCEWAAEYYRHPLGEVIAAALPGSLKHGDAAVLHRPQRWQLTPDGQQALATLPGRNRAQRSALEALQAGARGAGEWPVAPAIRARLVELGWVASVADDARQPAAVSDPLPLTAAQQLALHELEGGEQGFRVSLLEGVTGSGKTELYLRRLQASLDAGRQALVLVPEISLTPQLAQRLRERLGDGVLSFHSGMSEGEREQAWLAAREGTTPVIVGTRSAIFVPFARLGLIVVDEEHDASYKQQDGFRYSARDLAVVRAQRLKAELILGSATPSLESLHNAQAGRYRHVRLSERIHAQAPPRIDLLDVRKQTLAHGLAPPLLSALDRCLEAGDQALLFINRRGYAPILLCHACGWQAACAHCDARLTVHRGRSRLICHHCGAQQPLPRGCPSCGAAELMPLGQGTERIEQALLNRYPRKRIERLDSDRLGRRHELQRLLDDVRARRVDVLVGTQILAKGHDFPNLSLVGIVSADQALYGADFRAIERMGQLVTQVAGRAGRAGQRGEVLLQTHEPDHPLLRLLVERGYAGLSAALLNERREARLPPFSHLALLRAEARDAAPPMHFLAAARELLLPLRGLQVMEPIPSGMERRAGFVRAQLLVQAEQRSALQSALAAIVPRLTELARGVRWSIDVDPADLF
ncbi:primosomal protein N' [Solimonas terrae]|uniref:Replication restart protein PriA n=1 Tax=Solimonas terrae TaxID=1396819 RepID=A0A6M2BVP0_9GAMM|nr:primosomal protein N' [Solimonas terrae]NGY06454.1 primosomal protein N' [Solimonas terrae]